MFVGYKGYDKAGLTPLFPFGHGLSYTSFDYSGLDVTPTAEGLRASFTVTNSGSVAGSEVPQVYVDAPANAEVPMPVRSLVGYDRVKLAPGASQRVTVDVDSRELSYWSVEDHGWRLPAGARSVEVGNSSRDLRLKETNATAGAFNPTTSRAPDRDGYYTKPVTVGGQLAGVGGTTACTPVTYRGPEGTDIPVRVTCGGTTQTVTISYDATKPGVAVTKPARATRPASWNPVRGTVAPGAGSPVASVTTELVQRRGRAWFAYTGSRWVRAGSQGAELKRAAGLPATYADRQWTRPVRGLTAGRLVVRATAQDVAGNSGTTKRAQTLRR